MKSEKYFIMGLPGAGKTTYLAALWYIINNPNDSCFKIDQFTGDQSYITNISIKWANVQELARTPASGEKLEIEISLKNKINQNVTIAFPDLSGESFQFQFLNREIKSEHVGLIKNCNGVILFMHPEEILEHALISDVPLEFRTNEGTVPTSDFATWDAKKIPTQVQLVELLQFIKYLRNGLNTPLVVIVSAWDLVEKNASYTGPEDFIKNRTSLLWQYLKSNSDKFNVKYYGISAQGDELKKSEKLLEITNHCKRVFIVDNDGIKSNDITLPFNWLLNEKNEE